MENDSLDQGPSDESVKPKIVIKPIDEEGLCDQLTDILAFDPSSAAALMEEEDVPPGQSSIGASGLDSLGAALTRQTISKEDLIKSFVMDMPDSPDSSDSDTTGGNPLSLTQGCRGYLNVCMDYETNENFDAPRLKQHNRVNKYEKSGLRGICNIGNTCFMNSILQCLSNTAPLLRYILRDKFITEINSGGSTLKGGLLAAFVKLVKELWKADARHPVDTTMLKNQLQIFAPVFRGFSQQDAHELLRFLLDALHEELNRVQKKPAYMPFNTDPSWDLASHSHKAWQNYIRVDNSQIVDIFAGQLRSTLVCCDCGRTSVTFEPFWDLPVPIPSTLTPGSSEVTLEQCLEAFTREEVLDGNEKAFCSNCKSQQKTTKKFSIERFPEVLVIHLKRFRGEGKLRTVVRFPVIGFDLGPFTSNETSCCSYNLYGISSHAGSAASGHYVAYCKHPYNNTWSCYDDSNVRPIPVDDVKKTEGYVLFYEMSEGSKSVLF